MAQVADSDPSLANGIPPAGETTQTDWPKPVAQVESVQPTDGGERAVNVLAVLNIHNPIYRLQIPIHDITYHLETTSSADLAHGVILAPGSLTPHSNTRIEVIIKIHYAVLSGLVAKGVTELKLPYNLRIRVNVEMPFKGRVSVPCTYTSTIVLPTPPDLFDVKDGELEDTVDPMDTATATLTPSGPGWMTKILGPCCGVPQPTGGT